MHTHSHTNAANETEINEQTCSSSCTSNVYFYQRIAMHKCKPSTSMIAFHCQGIKEITKNKNKKQNKIYMKKTRNAANVEQREQNLRSRNGSSRSSRGGSGGSTRRGHQTCRDRNKNVICIFSFLEIALPISFARLRTGDEYYYVCGSRSVRFGFVHRIPFHLLALCILALALASA